MPLSLREKLKAVDHPKPKAETPLPVSSNCYGCSAQFPALGFPFLRTVQGCTLSLMQELNLPQVIDPCRILYLDTETTGLSGGVGTLAFLVGVGYFEENRFVVKQWLMRDYPEERYLLASLEELLSGFDLIITFNGKTFDVPLLQSRMLMNRMASTRLGCIPHLDVLHPARRIWKLRLGSCRLGRIEEVVFGEARPDDLPGSQVPERFFRYLATGDFTLLGDVLSHNRQDIVSLCRLFYRLLDVYEKPEQQSFIEDIFSAGKALEKRGQITLARKCYHLCIEGKMSAAAHSTLGQSFRHTKEIEEAIQAYTRMAHNCQGGILPYVELAKLYEHQRRDPLQALEYTKKALFLLSGPSLCPIPSLQEAQNALQYRYMRLLRKAQRATHAKEVPIP